MDNTGSTTIKICILLLFMILLLPAVYSADFFLEETLFEGDTRDFHEDGYPYTVTLIGVFDSQGKAQFEINGEKTDPMGEDDMDRLSDGSSIQVRSVFAQSGGADFVQYNFFPAVKIEETPEPEEEIEEVEVETTQEPQEPEQVISPEPEPLPEPEEATVEHKGIWRRFIDWLRSIF